MSNRAFVPALLIALVASTAVACHHGAKRDETPPIAHFAVVVEHDASGWKAHCETGCEWTDVSIQCAGCDVRIDAKGITHSSAPARTTPFAFELSKAEPGWKVRSLRGARWEGLTWGCASAMCRMRVDENGLAAA